MLYVASFGRGGIAVPDFYRFYHLEVYESDFTVGPLVRGAKILAQGMAGGGFSVKTALTGDPRKVDILL